MRKLYQVKLTPAQREQLQTLLRTGTANTHVITRSRVLLKAAAGWLDPRIAEAFEISVRTVVRIRQRFCEGGLENALYEKKRPGAARKLDERGQALLIATACSPAPTGHTHWTLQLLAERLVELQVVDSIALATVSSGLKKTNYATTKSNNGACPEA